MKIILFLLFCMVSTSQIQAQPAAKQIRQLLTKQAKDWSRGDIPAYMNGYWKSDSLVFIGSSGINYGWKNTLTHYQEKYPDAATMGQLRFDIVQVKPLSSDCYFVLGKWFLTRTAGDVNGHFTLIFRKFKNGWRIVSDHSS